MTRLGARRRASNPVQAFKHRLHSRTQHRTVTGDEVAKRQREKALAVAKAAHSVAATGKAALDAAKQKLADAKSYYAQAEAARATAVAEYARVSGLRVEEAAKRVARP